MYLLRDLLDVLLSEFEDRPFSMEDALDYVAFGEDHLLEEMIRLGVLIQENRDVMRIRGASLYQYQPDSLLSALSHRNGEEQTDSLETLLFSLAVQDPGFQLWEAN